MGHCVTCIYWNLTMVPPTRRYAVFQGYGVCESRKFVENAAAKREMDELVYPYDEGGFFITGPNFGCVHHKEKV
jgi:hypothetical protein